MSIVSSTVSGPTSRSGPAGRDAGVGDRDVDAAEAPREVVDRGGQRLRVAHVGDRGLGPGQRRGDPLEPLARRRRSAPSRMPRAGELAGELGADARRGAGDERHAPVEVPGHRHGTLKSGAVRSRVRVPLA